MNMPFKSGLGIVMFVAMVFTLASCGSSKKTTVSNKAAEKVERKDNSEVFIDANREKILGNYEEAEKLFNKSLSIDPQDAASMFELAKLHARKKQIDQALLFSENAAQTADTNAYYLMLYASLLQATEQYNKAAEVYKQLVILKPGLPEYYTKLAATYIFAGKPQEAIEVFNNLEKRFGVTEEFSMRKKNIYIQENKVNKAIAEIENLIENFPLEAKYYAILAEMCVEYDRPEKALEAYQKISEIDPDNPYIHISLADFHKKNGDSETAFKSLKKGFANPMLDIDTKIQILIQYYSINEIYDNMKEEAMELAEIMVKVHPQDPKAHSMHGDFLFQAAMYDEARDAFQTVISIDSSKYLVWEQLLFTQAELQDNDALLNESLRCIELFPEQSIPYMFAGSAYYMKKEWQECVDILEIGKTFVVNNDLLLAQFYTYMGDSYYQLDEHEKSDSNYDKALLINPDNDFVLNNYAYYLSLREEDLEKAAKMAKRATELKPNSSTNQDTYAWVLFKLEYYDEAKKWIEKALENGGDSSAVILEHYGDILWKLDEKDEAVKYWEKANETGEGSDLLDKKVSEEIYYE